MKKLSLILSVCLTGAIAQATLIDDFSGSGLGAYTLTRVLDNGVSEQNVSFSDAGGVLSAAYTGTINQPEQVVLLRSDFNLAVGNTLLVDTLFATQSSQMDLGIAVGATATPAGAVNPSPTDTRNSFEWASIYVRPSQNAVRSTSSTNGVVVTAAGVLNTDETLVKQLFIERTSLTDFTLGYYDTSFTRFISRTVTFTGTDVGTAIGFYADLRTAGGTLNGLDNLTITLIPEPTMGALLGLGALGMVARLRRK